jgi:hypothetical protein
MIFGVIGTQLGAKEICRYHYMHPSKEKMFWWYEHLQGMMASYIAAWTAFLIVTVARLSMRGGCGLCRRRLGCRPLR